MHCKLLESEDCQPVFAVNNKGKVIGSNSGKMILVVLFCFAELL